MADITVADMVERTNAFTLGIYGIYELGQISEEDKEKSVFDYLAENDGARPDGSFGQAFMGRGSAGRIWNVTRDELGLTDEALGAGLDGKSLEDVFAEEYDQMKSDDMKIKTPIGKALNDYPLPSKEEYVHDKMVEQADKMGFSDPEAAVEVGAVDSFVQERMGDGYGANMSDADRYMESYREKEQLEAEQMEIEAETAETADPFDARREKLDELLENSGSSEEFRVGLEELYADEKAQETGEKLGETLEGFQSGELTRVDFVDELKSLTAELEAGLDGSETVGGAKEGKDLDAGAIANQIESEGATLA